MAHAVDFGVVATRTARHARCRLATAASPALARARATTPTDGSRRRRSVSSSSSSSSPSSRRLRSRRVVARAGEDDPAAPTPAPLDDLEDVVEVENVDPMTFITTSTAFYVLMGVGSQVAASFLGVHPDVLDAMRACNVDQASLWTLPLLGTLAFAITQDEKYEWLGEVRDIFKAGVLPSIAPLGLPGVLALSLGAGVGEEAFFRGFLMPFADGKLLELGAPAEASSALVLASTSVFFGALHAITPAYFYWATGAGALFGLEYVRDGLGTAAFTHTLYDFLAFGFILIKWGPQSEEKSEASERS